MCKGVILRVMNTGSSVIVCNVEQLVHSAAVCESLKPYVLPQEQLIPIVIIVVILINI